MPRTLFGFDRATLAALDGTDMSRAYAGDSLTTAWDALRIAFPVETSRWAPILSGRDELDRNALVDAMLTTGELAEPGAPLSTGMLVEHGGDRPFSGDWSVVVDARGAQPATVVTSTDQATFAVVDARGPIRCGWRPGPSLVIDPASPAGVFWGPALWRYRSVLTDTWGALALGDLLAFVFRDMPVKTGSVADVVAAVRPELTTPTANPAPGTLLLDAKHDRFGLVVSGGLAVVNTSGVEWRLRPVTETRMDAAWVPHC